MQRIGCAIVLLFLCGCGSSLAPLYRDYVPVTPSVDTSAIGTVLSQSGWKLQQPVTKGTWRTHSKWMEDWGLYRIRVSLDVVPLRGGTIRVFFHPYRIFIVGGRSKMMYLRGALKHRLFTSLDGAFESAGYQPAGSLFERDRIRIGQ